jgi:hypothetical protein
MEFFFLLIDFSYFLQPRKIIRIFLRKRFRIIYHLKPALTKNILTRKENKTQDLEKLRTIFLLHPSMVRDVESSMPPLGFWRSKARVGESLKKKP